MAIIFRYFKNLQNVFIEDLAKPKNLKKERKLSNCNIALMQLKMILYLSFMQKIYYSAQVNFWIQWRGHLCFQSKGFLWNLCNPILTANQRTKKILNLNTLWCKTLSEKSDEFFEKWQKFRVTKISPNKITTICLNDLWPS